MSPTFERPGLGIEIPFVVLATITWLLGLILTQNDGILLAEDLTTIAPFITFAIAVSFFILRMIGYFDVIRLFPRRSDLVLVIFAIPLGGVATWFVNSALMRISDPLLLKATLATPFLTLLTFGVHHIFANLKIKSLGTQKIVLDLNPQERALVIQDLAGWGFLQRLEILSRQDLETELLGPNPRSISLVIISPSTAKSFEDDETILEAHLAGITIADYRRVCARLSGRIRLGHSNVWEYVLSATPQTMLIRAYSGFKNITEPFIAAILAFLLSPVMLAVAVLIKLSGTGPVLFRQTRVGYKQVPFELIKFRTMRTDAESAGAKWCQENDTRITKVGKFLRKTRLDELPQLWNVACGEMSFIGPRPEQPILEQRLREQIPGFALRTLVKPGISGWAQVCAGYAASVDESRLKLEYDLFYIQNMSPRLDLIVLLRTICTAIWGDKKLKNTVVVELSTVLPKFNTPLLGRPEPLAGR